MTAREEESGEGDPRRSMPPADGGGPRERRRPPPPMFLVAVGAFAVATLALIAVSVSAACGGGTGNEGSPSAAATATPTRGGQPSAPPSPTRAPSTVPGSPTAVDPGTASPNAPIVACGNVLVPLDKQHRLADTCVPGSLEEVPAAFNRGGQRMAAPALQAMVEMLTAAAKEGQNMAVVSGYRSYQDQVDTYDYWVRTLGQKEADRTSARPGFSEHQLGTTADLSAASVGYDLVDTFGTTPEGRWLVANSWKYGFIISYPDGKESVTGYAYEPWHVRWIGKTEAANVKNSGLTLHEYLLRP